MTQALQQAPSATLLSRGTLRAARISIAALFLLHGLTVATWVSRIPAIQDKLRLSPKTLGWVLLCAAAGSLIAMPATGMVSARYGSRLPSFISSIGFTLTLLGLGYAPSLAWLAVGLLLYGAMAGSMDVSMNAQAVGVEQGYQRPIMSSFHALFSFGAMLGAALSGAVAKQGIEPGTHFLMASLLLTLATLVCLPALLPSHVDAAPKEKQGQGLRYTRPLALLGILAFCVLLTEGAMADWTAVYLHTALHAGEDRAALGFAAFSATMALGRAIGDKLTAHVGRVALVAGGSLLAALGIGGALLVGTEAAAFTGFACAGAGLSVIVPLVFGAAGRATEAAPGMGLAAVTTAGYTGFLLGPPAIGMIAEAVGLRFALCLLVVLCSVSIPLAKAVRVR